MAKIKITCSIDLFHNKFKQVLWGEKTQNGQWVDAELWPGFELPFQFLLGYIYRICLTPDRITVASLLPNWAFWLAHVTDIQICAEMPAKCHNGPPIDSKLCFIKSFTQMPDTVVLFRTFCQALKTWRIATSHRHRFFKQCLGFLFSFLVLRIKWVAPTLLWDLCRLKAVQALDVSIR